ncbi:hypothetical protein TY91_15935 [Secundilactobacillus collinoides]|uniref:Uncharacterized protein n=1 Tax=Secundilactobacillus collinoides TaxID=33960 RepID=A0A166FQQ8_SECCO|nr:hypothetical protein TY91_15935 [Secundilactobacillus collinoides]
MTSSSKARFGLYWTKPTRLHSLTAPGFALYKKREPLDSLPHVWGLLVTEINTGEVFQYAMKLALQRRIVITGTIIPRMIIESYYCYFDF